MAMLVRVLGTTLRTACVVTLLGCFSTLGAETIAGAVKDAQGGVMPGVSITIRNVDTGLERTLVTNSVGRYVAANLLPGRYEVQASLQGFRTVVRRGIVLTVGQDLVIDLAMEVGEFNEDVVVAGGAPLVDTTSAAVSGLVDEKAIRDLPLNGRSFDELITLHAGASVNRTASRGGAQGFAAKFSISGQRAGSTKFYQDGTELQGSSREQEQVGSAAGVLLGVEAIKEFRVLTSSYSPQFGKKGGGVVLTITKSGTNALHGSLLEFHRNSAMDARNFFAVGKNPFKRNHFGGSLGGPVVRNRTFFFANYEGLRQSLSTPFSAVVPDENARRGFLPGPNGLINVGVNPKITPYLDLWPVPNSTNFGDGTAAYQHAPVGEVREDFVLGRIDHEFSPAHSVFASYTLSDANDFSPMENPFFATDTNTRDQRATVEYRHLVSSQMVNTFRFGFSRSFHSIDVNALTEFGPGVVPFTPGQNLGSIGVTGLTDTGGTQGDTYGGKNSFQFSDQVSYSRGRHSFEFGGEFHRSHMKEDPVDRKRGLWEFQGLLELLTLNPRRFGGAFPPGVAGELNLGLSLDPDPLKSWRQNYLGLYVRDRIEWRDNLTVDLGLRYEVLTSPTETEGRVSNFIIQEVRAPFARVLSSTPVIGEKIWPTNYKAGFAPRLGVTWDPFGKQRTVVRGGFGIFYDQIDNEYRFYTHINPPFSARADTLGSQVAGAFPTPWSVIPTNQIQLQARSVDPDIDVPTILHYNVGIQQEVGPRSVLNIAYVGAQGDSLLRQMEVNYRIPQLIDGRKFWATTAPVPQPLLGQAVMLFSNADSEYNALQTEFETRFGDSGPLGRLRSKVSYTFSKSMDSASILQGAGGANDTNRTTDPFEPDAEWALSGHHLAHRFSFNFTYLLADLPLQGVARALFNDWQLNGIVTVTSGFPVNLSAGFNVSRDGQGTDSDRPSLVEGGDASPVLGGPNLYFDPSQFVLPTAGFKGNLGRNTLMGPGFATVDFSVVKQVAVSDGFRVHLRAEVFNLLNRPNFGVPERRIFNSRGQVMGTVGRITSTSSTSRQVQLGVKLEF